MGRTVDWVLLEREFAAVYTDDLGLPPLRKRLKPGLPILKHTYNLSDEVPCERWVENTFLSVLLRRGVLPAPAGVRLLVADALAQPDGRQLSSGSAARAGGSP